MAPRAKPVPGEPTDPNVRGARPTGDADAVFFFGAIEVSEFNGGPAPVVVVLAPSMERQAVRYLKPCSDAWHKRMPGHFGVLEDIRLRNFNTWLPSPLQQDAREQGRVVHHIICPESPLAQDALGLRHNLEIVEAEPGVWCGYYSEQGA
jgi:hypothetical protein